jgi:hypothetical protein
MTFDLNNENGVALPVVTWMLVVVSLLVTAFFTVSLRRRPGSRPPCTG